jgi:D-alanine-D-alanine ligase
MTAPSLLQKFSHHSVRTALACRFSGRYNRGLDTAVETSHREDTLRILVITGDHTVVDPEKVGGRYNEEDLKAHRVMEETFASLPGVECTVLADHGRFLDLVREEHFDLVVNFCDTGYRNRILLEPHVPAYLELLDVPYTGAPPAALALVYDKAIVRLVAEALSVPVPAEIYLPFEALTAPPPDGPYPALIKPNRADGSLGITKDAVVRSPEEARAYLDWYVQALPGRDALFQEYLTGTEYGVGLIGNTDEDLEALPALEVDFSNLPEGLNPILSYESKAMPDSPYWTEIKFRRAELTTDEEAELVNHSRRLFRRLGLRDYGRFDFRRSKDGLIKLMEANTNPAWAYDAKLALMAGFAGITYPQMLQRILDTAARRCGLAGT